MEQCAVVIAGGGPTGMMLAAELALAKVDVVLLERRPDHDLAGSRAGGLHARTVEVLDQRGVADRFLAEGRPAQAATFGTTVLDMRDLPTRHPYALGLWQNAIERILAGWIGELPVDVRYGAEVTGCSQDPTGVDVRLAGGETLRARFLVGCDGGRSLVRRECGIDFPGLEATRSNLIAEVDMAGTPELGIRHDAAGIHSLGRVDYEIRDGEIVYPDHGPVRVLITECELGDRDEPTLEELRAAIVGVYGTDFGLRDAVWISRFTDATRQAAAYRDRRVLLAGDAAHIHYPAGGQGISLGIQDAANLGWKLGQVVAGTSPEDLLDTYHAERHPVGARTIRHTIAQAALQRRDERMAPLVELVSELAAMDEPRTLVAGRVSGLDIRYDLGDGHPLLGRRMPDLDVATAGGPCRVFSFLHDARPLLLDLGAADAIGAGPWADRVRVVRAAYNGRWELPVVGPVDAPAAVLVRPDGYVAWVGDGTARGLAEALATWFGPRTSSTAKLSSTTSGMM